MDKKCLAYADISIVQPINPETAAHNIALTYIQPMFGSPVSSGNDVDPDVIFAISSKYVDAYNYAYNFICHQNSLINEAE